MVGWQVQSGCNWWSSNSLQLALVGGNSSRLEPIWMHGLMDFNHFLRHVHNITLSIIDMLPSWLQVHLINGSATRSSFMLIHKKDRGGGMITMTFPNPSFNMVCVLNSQHPCPLTTYALDALTATISSDCTQCVYYIAHKKTLLPAVMWCTALLITGTFVIKHIALSCSDNKLWRYIMRQDIVADDSHWWHDYVKVS